MLGIYVYVLEEDVYRCIDAQGEILFLLITIELCILIKNIYITLFISYHLYTFENKIRLSAF